MVFSPFFLTINKKIAMIWVYFVIYFTINKRGVMKIPKPTQARLIQLLRLLSQLKDITVTSLYIQNLTGWTNTTVRKDISYITKLQPIKSASNGYNRIELLHALSSVLEAQNPHEKKTCCLVGLGKIAQALIQSNNFGHSSFELQAGFDASKNRIETLTAPFPLYPLNVLEEVITAEHIEYAVLDVEDKDACAVAKTLSDCGVKGIVNYTNTILSVGKKTKTENVSILHALQNLAYQNYKAEA